MVGKENLLYYFLLFVREIGNTTYDYNKSKIEYSFYELKYPIILFNLLPMNEDDFHNDPEYSDLIIELFSNKEYYKNGKLKNDTALRVNELYKLRNCIAHGQYYIKNDDLILFDNKESFIFNSKQYNRLGTIK